MRVPDATVYNQANGIAAGIQSTLATTGLWRLLVFAGDVANPNQLKLVNDLNEDLLRLLGKYPSASVRRPERFMEILTFHSAGKEEVESESFEPAFFPSHPVDGRNYDTIFADYMVSDRSGGSHHRYGVDASKGALALVRPDQMVAWVGYLADLPLMDRWLETFMIQKAGKQNGT